LDSGDVALGLIANVLLQLVTLVAVVEELYYLFNADGNAEAEDDGGDVDEEVAPGAGGVVSCR
jgi:hypothetical protein